VDDVQMHEPNISAICEYVAKYSKPK